MSYWIKRRLNIDVLITLFLFMGSLALYWPGIHHDLGWGGVSTVGAERVLAGAIPYRDFWTMYAPGHFYLLALLFYLFGTHILVERIAAAVICAAVAGLCYGFVLSIKGSRWLALACAGVFFAANYNTGYFKNLGTYPPAIFLILVTLILIVFYYQHRRPGYLIAAGLVTGILTAFKHDVGGYTAIAIGAGLLTEHILNTAAPRDHRTAFWLKLASYAGGVLAIVAPILLYFASVAGPDAWQNVIIFPLTDFRYARPEGYPSLLPFWIYTPKRLFLLQNLTTYINFAVPFGLLLLGLFATGQAIIKRKAVEAAIGVTLTIGGFLHYMAAHVQINTHIVSMSVYSSFLGAIFYRNFVAPYLAGKPRLLALVPAGLMLGWMLSFAAQPMFLAWAKWPHENAALQLPKVSGVKVTPAEARSLAELSAFVEAHVPPGQTLFVGLHRHDVIIIGDVMSYFVLNRPGATRYQELHPAIADTARVQQEIIADLEKRNVSLVILKYIFSDDELEAAKTNFLEHLPQIGATDLDNYIHQNFEKVRQIDTYAVFLRKGTIDTEPTEVAGSDR